MVQNMFKVNGKENKMTPLTIDVVLVFLLLTLNIELPAKNVV